MPSLCHKEIRWVLAHEKKLRDFVSTIIEFSLERNTDKIINLFCSETKPDGIIDPRKQEKLNVWNLLGFHYLRQGEYSKAEKLYSVLYEKLLEQQKILGHLNKGNALHLLARSLLHQRKTETAIKFSICAYIEDIISEQKAEIIEKTPVNRVLQRICACAHIPQKEILKIKDFVLHKVDKKITFNPELIYNLTEVATIALEIQKKYRKNTAETYECIQAEKRFQSLASELSMKFHVIVPKVEVVHGESIMEPDVPLIRVSAETKKEMWEAIFFHEFGHYVIITRKKANKGLRSYVDKFEEEKEAWDFVPKNIRTLEVENERLKVLSLRILTYVSEQFKPRTPIKLKDLEEEFRIPKSELMKYLKYLEKQTIIRIENNFIVICKNQEAITNYFEGIVLSL